MKKLSTDPYKGTRDFYPEDMAVQRYIFDTWSYTAENFGYERYDASVLEPSELYKSKGAENEEMVGEQTYTFTDRGDREVTLRPEMTPTAARMIAAKQKSLSFPVRWYAIPNLFRYERPQKGRLREHWQLNCDIFGVSDISADIEIIALANQVLVDFGATPEMFEIRVNNRATMHKAYEMLGIHDDEKISAITRLNDRKNKMEKDEYLKKLSQIIEDESLAEEILGMLESKDGGDNAVVAGLKQIGIHNVVLDRSLARGFDYYTGTIFEIFDTSDENNRSLIGGGRYDNLTGLFSDESVTGVGFGMGDVTMRDFLETHDLLTSNITGPEVMIIPTDANKNLEAQKIAQLFRNESISTAVDMSDRKIGKKISSAGDALVSYALVLGEDEVASQNYTLKNLTEGTEVSGSIDHLIKTLQDYS